MLVELAGMMTLNDALAKACQLYLDAMESVRATGGEIPLIEQEHAGRNGDSVRIRLQGSPREIPNCPYPRFEFPEPVRIEDITVGEQHTGSGC